MNCTHCHYSPAADDQVWCRRCIKAFVSNPSRFGRLESTWLSRMAVVLLTPIILPLAIGAALVEWARGR